MWNVDNRGLDICVNRPRPNRQKTVMQALNRLKDGKKGNSYSPVRIEKVFYLS